MSSAYNHSWHFSINMTLAAVNIYNSETRNLKTRLRIMFVSGSRNHLSTKAYTTRNYTDEIFQVSKAYHRQSLPTDSY